MIQVRGGKTKTCIRLLDFCVVISVAKANRVLENAIEKRELRLTTREKLLRMGQYAARNRICHPGVAHASRVLVSASPKQSFL